MNNVIENDGKFVPPPKPKVFNIDDNTFIVNDKKLPSLLFHNFTMIPEYKTANQIKQLGKDILKIPENIKKIKKTDIDYFVLKKNKKIKIDVTKIQKSKFNIYIERRSTDSVNFADLNFADLIVFEYLTTTQIKNLGNKIIKAAEEM